MARIKRARGESPAGPGRPRIVDKHGRYVNAAERAFAVALPAEAERYLAELLVKEPEQCPGHGLVLRCPECGHRSERTKYDHRAASYVFDRIMGKPTTRSENVITVRLVQELTAAFVTAFIESNAINDPLARHAAFTGRCAEIGVQYGGPAA